MVNQIPIKKIKDTIPPRRDPAIGGIIAVAEGILGIAAEIGYALVIMSAAFFICIVLTSF